MTILDPCMSLERIKIFLGVLGVVDMRQLLLNTYVAASMAKLRKRNDHGLYGLFCSKSETRRQDDNGSRKIWTYEAAQLTRILKVIPNDHLSYLGKRKRKKERGKCVNVQTKSFLS